MELAFFYLFMGVGVPSVFYGDEVYIEGMKELEYRAAMDWQAVMEQQIENNRLQGKSGREVQLLDCTPKRACGVTQGQLPDNLLQ